MSAQVIHRKKQAKSPLTNRGARKGAVQTTPIPAQTASTVGERAVDLGQLFRAIQDLGDGEQKLIAATVDILKAHEGCTTPIEAFIIDLLFRYRMGDGAVTPDEAEHLLETFRDDFVTAIANARRYARCFPALVPTISEVPHHGS